MPDITAGYTYTDTSGLNYTVNHSNLNSLIGSATINTGVITTAKLNDGSVTNAKVDAAAGITFTKLASLTSGTILLGSSGNVATSTAVSGDVTITSIGVVTIANDAVTTVKVLDANITTAKLADRAVTTAKMQLGTQGDVLYYGSGGDPALLAAGSDGQLLKSGGAGADVSWRDAPLDASQQKFTSSGTWTRPTGATMIHVMIIAAGGGSTRNLTHGHGGEGAKVSDFIDVSEDTTVAVTVGAAGTAGNGYGGHTSWVAGGDGGSSGFGSYIVAAGGGGAYSSNAGNSIAGDISGANGTVTTATDTAVLVSLANTDGYGAGGTPEDHSSSAPGEAGGAGLVVVTVIG